MARRVSRRAVLAGVGGTALALGVGVPLATTFTGDSSTGAVLASELPIPSPFVRPLTVPPVLRPVLSTPDGDRYEIVQRETRAELLPGVPTTVWGYDGIVPGPTIVTPRGRRTVVGHRNLLPVPTVVHLHGGKTAPEHDGYPTDLVLPDGPAATAAGHGAHGGGGAHGAQHGGLVVTGSRDYEYLNDQRAATLWYHDHRMDFTGPSVWRGLAGVHVITDPEERALELPDGDHDIPLVVMDRSFGSDGELRYPSVDASLRGTPGVSAPYESGVLGDVVLVNGTAWPFHEVDAVRHRFRLLNASNARRYRLRLDPAPPGGGIVQVGSDGGLLERPVPRTSVDLAPAERQDLIVDFGAYPVGTRVRLVNDFGEGRTREVMEFRVVRAGRDESRVPEVLSRIEPLDPSQAAVTRDMVFRSEAIGEMRGWTINGVPFDTEHVHAEPALGDVEVWNIYSDFHHPFHMHLVHFQVLGRNNGGPAPSDAGWKDTLDLRPAEQARVITRFEGHRGRYVFHCHNLEHEDMMMMGNFRVT